MKRSLPIILLLLCTAGFAFGVFELFKLRFDVGDVYPPYSSLRADPLGTSAYYESLAKMPGISVSRDFRMTDEMPEGRGVVYLHLAGDRIEWDDLSEDTFKQVDGFVHAGGRLVVALYPESVKAHVSRFEKPAEEKKTQPADEKTNKSDTKTKDDKKADNKKPGKSLKKKNILGNSDESFKSVVVAEKWGVGFDIKNLKPGEGTDYEPATVENTTVDSLPPEMEWHSGVVMTNLDPAWHVIYARGADAVVAERKFGAGTVVFATDCYFLSNEAMQKDRHAELLAWLIGPSREVMFDEARFGIVNNPGIATLMRKYRLGGLAFALFLLAVMFIWKNSLGFGPVREAERAESYVVGKDSAAGFTNLLRHHIKSQEVLNTCFAEWKKSFTKGKLSSARLERVEAFIQTENQRPPGERDPVKAYQTIAALLARSTQIPTPDSNPKKP
jgi:hypothetical protein